MSRTPEAPLRPLTDSLNMRPNLSWTLSEEQGSVRVTLAGEITEAADFSRLLAELPDTLVLDLAGIERVNSRGVREWFNFVKALNGAGKQFALERCSLSAVTQLNNFSEFAGGAPVRSVFAPYYCDACGQMHQRLVTINGTELEQINTPFKCPDCGRVAEFDDLPDDFLSFLK